MGRTRLERLAKGIIHLSGDTEEAVAARDQLDAGQIDIWSAISLANPPPKPPQDSLKQMSFLQKNGPRLSEFWPIASATRDGASPTYRSARVPAIRFRRFRHRFHAVENEV
jgi:hypothetical protein